MRAGGKVRDLFNRQKFYGFLKIIQEELKVPAKQLARAENKHLLNMFARFAFSMMVYQHGCLDAARQGVKQHNALTHNGTRQGQMQASLRAEVSLKEAMRNFR